MAGWSTLEIDQGLVSGYEPDDTEASKLAKDSKVQAAVRKSLRSRLRSYLTPIIDSEGVTESVFFDEVADMTATTDARAALAELAATEHLYRFYRSKSDRPGAGEHDAKRRDLYAKDAEHMASDYAALVRRALSQDEITFDTGEVTRDQEVEVTWII